MAVFPVHWRRWKLVPFLIVLTLAAGMTAASAGQETEGETEGTPPAMTCDAVAQLDLGAIPGASTIVTSAKVMAAGDNDLGDWQACDVQGVIAPQLQFDLRLPLSGWQRNYLQVGCGGNCGVVNLSDVPASEGCTPLTTGAFAVATDNQGHSVNSAIFATDPTLKADFGYKSEHELSVVAKEIINRFYGQPAAESYFDGCSQGGHESLTEAQRYPTDFDGIIAGAPANIFTALNVISHAWNAQVVYTDHGKPTLTTADLAPLHDAVLKGCGATDGIIADPVACTWDPGSIQCRAGSAGFCLTPAQVDSVRKLYSGPVDEHGKLLYPGGQERGSELNWAGVLVPETKDAPPLNERTTETLRYQVYPQARGDLTFEDVQFTDRYFDELMRMDHGILDATDADLSAFKAAGGKLILWQGLGDEHVAPAGTIAYYQAVQQAMGGAEKTNAFARLFLLPGVAHCGGGQGPDSFDALTALTDWVTKGKAPDSIVTENPDNGSSRPVYPFPYVAEKTATGYAPRLSTAQQDLRIDWVGDFRSGYETVSGWTSDGRWVTRPGKN
ncbi:tannase/feruloyl esterase family alpha/beta hydrolase [Amycolatopsis acidicola]|uniref:Tannase/feruloyl esterase family alpha/beta hydrolase n=1 Tax=Amycolatopsis acidicola TaxID=2596893 RepID=A0A5N0V1B7_9PSEU|nr:tannase/feruloyl esterase family alpha/beta hydrolase [Amycolatopsis acidicola]KAA9157807.1 tannase/feruloyl esterase family alpha/beta hydrolase [Amycolatopsis acidicola]